MHSLSNLHTMRHLIYFFIFYLLLAINSKSPAIASTPQINFNLGLPTADTAAINCLAKQAIQLINSPKSKHQSKQLLDSANSLVKANMIETPTMLYIANAEYYLSDKDFVKAYDFLKLTFESVQNKKDVNYDIIFNDLNARYCLWGGLFTECIKSYNENLRISETHFIKGLKTKSLLGLSNVYDALNNQDQSIHYLELMLEAAKSENILSYVETAHSSLGLKVMDFKKDYKLAQYHFNQSLAISETLKDSSKIIGTKSRIAWNYYLQNMLDSSIFCYTRLLADLKGNNYVYLANTYGNLGTVFRDKKDLLKARENYDKAISFALQGRHKYSLSWIYKDMSIMYVRNRNFENAYNYYALYTAYNDSLNNTNFNAKLIDARVRYDVKEKEQKVELLSLKVKNQSMYIFGFAGFLALSILIGFLLIRQSKLSARRRISEMNQKISEITQANLRQQMNPHFIFNTLNSIQYYMYQHDKLATNNYLTKFSSLMRRILENSQHTSIPLNDELDAVNLYLELESFRFKDKFEYEITIDDEIDTIMYKIPTMLIQPYVENAICHGLMNKEDKGYLKININLKSDHLACIIEDNGIGREAAKEIKLKKEINHNSLGTRITESRLDLVNLLYGTSLTTIYTDLVDENGKPNGTRVEIQIPILT